MSSGVRGVALMAPTDDLAEDGSNDSVPFEESFFLEVEFASSSFPMGGKLLLLVVVLSIVDSMCFR